MKRQGITGRCLGLFRGRQGNGDEGARWRNTIIMRFPFLPTTRAPASRRAGRTENTFFLTDGQFEELIQNDQPDRARPVCRTIITGLPDPMWNPKMAEGKDVILEIEIQGALNVKKAVPGRASCIFVVPPTAAELKRTAGEPRNRDGGSDRQPSKTGSGGIRAKWSPMITSW